MPGKYLKSATKACVGKTKFSSQQEAERTAEYRFRAYLCAVCHQWHLTSRSGPAVRPLDEPREEPKVEKPRPLATLGDLEWGQLQDRGKPSARTHPPRQVAEPSPRELRELAKCLDRVRKDGRVVLDYQGVVVKSQPVLPSLRGLIKPGSQVVVAPSPNGPIIVEIA